MSWCWDKFVIEGDVLFDFMTCNFENMLDNTHIKHFTIRDGIYGYIYDTFNFVEEYDTIQKSLISWMKNEREKSELFKSDNWKPFRDGDTLIDMYLGYKQLFQYEHFYFQLALETVCEYDCIDCTDDITTHFSLALYGWKDDVSDTLCPYNEVVIKDNIIPLRDWNRK
jgi:hypothetical protein